jgi:hypothetical protein
MINFFVVAMIFITIIGSTGFKAVLSENCDGVCTNPDEPCCCAQKDGYYVSSYTCACAGGQLQWQKCTYAPKEV